MATFNFKKGLFGYTQSSVKEYVDSVNAELLARSEKFLEETDEFKKKCEAFEAEIENLASSNDELLEKINDLTKEIEALKSEKKDLEMQLEYESTNKVSYEQAQAELADIMVDAKRFSADMKIKAEAELEEKRKVNENRIKQERERIEKYIADVDELGYLLCKVCDNFGKDINGKKAELRIVFDQLSELG